MATPDVVLVAPVRTGIGREGGALAAVPAELLGAAAVRAVVERSGVNPAHVDDVVMGNQFGGSRLARHAALLGGLPEIVPGMTINRLCGSGLEAVVVAARAVQLGDAAFVIAGGAESYSQAPYLLERPHEAYQRDAPRFVSGNGAAVQYAEPTLGLNMSMGLTAEKVAELAGISRAEQDAFAVTSHLRAAEAAANGALAAVTVPVAVQPDRPESPTFAGDECVRPDSTPEKLARLPALFKPGGTVTAGNTSKRSDAAAAMLVTTADRARALSMPVVGRYLGAAVVGLHPTVMGTGPVPATRRLLACMGMKAGALDLIELNEAFASQALAVIRELDLDPDRVNVLGGAIAHGHPSGATGALLTVKLLSELHRRGGEYGLVTMCIGGGMGIAALFAAP